jgi:hypothetical protein
MSDILATPEPSPGNGIAYQKTAQNELKEEDSEKM